MLIIIGLGNPGEKYLNTRHNIGFRIIDEFARENNFPEFKLSKPLTIFSRSFWKKGTIQKMVRGKKFNSLISEGIFSNKKIILVKPQAFMNNSGQAVKSLTSFYKPESFVVIHDDIDLPLGKIRISKNRGSAGHKGVESIIKEIGNKDFIRLRFGIQPEKGKPRNPERFVIQRFSRKEEETIKQAVQESIQAVKSLIAGFI